MKDKNAKMEVGVVVFIVAAVVADNDNGMRLQAL